MAVSFSAAYQWIFMGGQYEQRNTRKRKRRDGYASGNRASHCNRRRAESSNDGKTGRRQCRSREDSASAQMGALRFILAAVTLITGIAGGAYYFRNIEPYESTDDAYIDGHVISISPQVAALVAAIHIDDNQYVHKGDLLVELDPTDYEVALNQARGAEASAKGKLEQSRAGVDTAESAVVQARAAVESSQATLENANHALKRYEGLSTQARSQQDVDTATANRKTAAAGVEQAKAQLQAAQSQVISAKANVIAADGDFRKARADTNRAEVNLGYCRIVGGRGRPNYQQGG